MYDESDPASFDGSNFTDLPDRTSELAPEGDLSIDQISSFAEDDAGNLYILDLGGEIFRIVSTSSGTGGDPVADAAVHTEMANAVTAGFCTGDAMSGRACGVPFPSDRQRIAVSVPPHGPWPVLPQNI